MHKLFNGPFRLAQRQLVALQTCPQKPTSANCKNPVGTQLKFR